MTYKASPENISIIFLPIWPHNGVNYLNGLTLKGIVATLYSFDIESTWFTSGYVFVSSDHQCATDVAQNKPVYTSEDTTGHASGTTT